MKPSEIAALYKKTALEMRKHTSGQPLDQDLAIYQKMTPNDFAKLKEKHGLDAVLEYIRDMEVRASGLEK